MKLGIIKLISYVEGDIKMPFIGIVGRINDSNFIKNEITKNAELNKFETININLKSIQNVKNIKFDIIVVNENIENLLKYSKYLEDIIRKSNYLIINSDIKNNLVCLKNTKTNIITYGFNAKATITISSVKEEDVLICIQRNFKGVDERVIEEQEFCIKLKKNNVNKLYNVMIIFAILNIYGEKLQKI